MAYFTDLENIILQRHLSNEADELIILSGYISAGPVEKLSEKSIRSKVIWGTLQRDKRMFTKSYHEKYKDITNDVSNSMEVFYKNTYDHSKIYCWLRNDRPIDILAGSANFTNSALKSTNEEFLFDVDSAKYTDVHNYLKTALSGSVSSINASAPVPPTPVTTPQSSRRRGRLVDTIISDYPPTANIYLGGANGKVQERSGLNWGQGEARNRKNDGCLRIGTPLVKSLPSLFPNQGKNLGNGRGQGYRSRIAHAEILFDDGVVMDVSFEGGNGDLIKQLTSFPGKDIFGGYFRKRLGVGEIDKVTDQDLSNYGRNHITLTLLAEGVYYADFSKPNARTGENTTI